MPMLQINELDMTPMADGFTLTDVAVENYERSARGLLEGTTYTIKKEITFTTQPMSPSDARALEGWVLGRNHLWTFSARGPGSTTLSGTPYSKDAGINLIPHTGPAATYTYHTRASHPVKGDRSMSYSVPSSGTYLVGRTTIANDLQDWSIHVYHSNTAVSPLRTSCAIVKRGGTETHYINGGVVAAQYVLGRLIAEDRFEVRLIRSVPATNTYLATSTFAHLSVAPYAYTQDMLDTLANADESELPRPPYVVVSGELVDNEVGMVMKGFVEGQEVFPATINGVYYKDARQLNIRLLER